MRVSASTWSLIGAVGRAKAPAASDATAASPGGEASDRPAGSSRRARFRIAFVAIVVLALVVRLAYILATPGFVPLHDAHHYDLDARYIANTHHYPPVYGPHGAKVNAYRPPAYSYTLAIVYKANGLVSFLGLSRWDAARILGALLGAVAVALLGFIAYRIWGRRVALIAGALGAVFPPMVFVATSMYSEALFVPLILAGTAAVVQYRVDHRRRTLVLAGVLTGLAALTREYGVTLLVPFIAGVWGTPPRRTWCAAKPAAVLVACTVLTVVPWTIRNAVVMHAFVPVSTSTGNTLAGTYNDIARKSKKAPGAWFEPSKMRTFRSLFKDPSLSQAQLDLKLRSRVLSYIAAHPTYPLVVGYWNTVRLLELAGWARSELTAGIIGVSRAYADVGVVTLWLVALLALGGAVTRAARRGPRWLWLVPVMMYVAIVFVQSESPRFRSPIDPFLVILAALALSTAWGRLTPGGGARLGTAAR